MSARVAVVTGASGGIGRAIASRLARDDHAVVVHYATNRSAARELVDALRDAGVSAWAVPADLATETGIESAVTMIQDIINEDLGRRLSVVVNNASLMLSPSFGETSVSDFDRYFAVNIRAPFVLTQRLADLMVDGASVVNISSAAAHFSSPNDIAYAMTKAALEAMTMHAAPSLARRGIRINTVIPGFTDNGHPAFDDPHVLAHMSSFAVMGGVAAPEVVADAVSFLVSDRASRTTGASLDVSGGSTIGGRPSGTGTVSLRQWSASSSPTP